MFRLSAILHRVKEIVKLNNLPDDGLTKDISDALGSLDINVNDAIIIPNTNRKNCTRNMKWISIPMNR